jgi:hypothetical protein
MKLEIFCVRLEVFTAVTRKNSVFWDALPFGSCKKRNVGENYRLHNQGGKKQRARYNVSSN